MSEEKEIKSSKSWLLLGLIGIVVNLGILVGINEFCFCSTIYDGIKPVDPATTVPPAARLVLFLTEGLSYARIYNFTHLLQHQRSHGIALAQFPTSRRAGLQAILCGVRQRPLASIFNTTHPRADSLLRRSVQTWYWESENGVFGEFVSKDMDNVQGLTCPQKKLAEEWIVDDIKRFLRSSKNYVFQKTGLLFLIHLPQLKDTHLETICALFSEAYKDHSTAFALTSTHGMTSWGSHGGDTQQEMEVPFVLWGAGARHNIKRVDLKQTDITPLIACLIGISIPVNSLGVIPLDYFDLQLKQYVSEQGTNALQLSNILKARIRAAGPPFKFFKISEEFMADMFSYLKVLFLSDEYEKIFKDCARFIEEIVAVIESYQIIGICCLFLSQVFWTLHLLGRCFERRSKGQVYMLTSLMWISFLLTFVLVPWSFAMCAYFSFFLTSVALAFPYLKLSLFGQKEITLLLLTQPYFLSVFYRQVVTVALVLLGLAVPALHCYKMLFSLKEKLCWSVGCIALSAYVFFPRLHTTPMSPVHLTLGFFIWVGILFKWGDNGIPSTSQKVFFLLSGLYKAIGRYNYTFSAILAFMPVATSITSKRSFHTLTFGLLPLYLTLSLSDELIPYALLFNTLHLWKSKEEQLCQDIAADDFRLIRQVVTGLLFSFAGFYGPGNVFSVSSYNYDWFLPFEGEKLSFVWASLLVVLKLAIPVAISVFTLQAVVRTDSDKANYILLTVLNVIILEMLLLLFVPQRELLPKTTFSSLTVMVAVSVTILVNSLIFQHSIKPI